MRKQVDERYLRIIKEMGYGYPAYDEWTCFCLYCDTNERLKTYRSYQLCHKEDCPVLLARQIMREEGLPLLEYKIAYEEFDHWNKAWKQYYTYITAYTEEEASAYKTANEDLTNHILPNVRNVQVQRIQEVRP